MTGVCITPKGNKHSAGTDTLNDKVRVTKGIYLTSEEAQDRLYYLQTKYSRGIFSNNTALFLFGYVEHLDEVTMTFPQGYNVSSLKDEGIIVRKLIPENYSADIEEIQTAKGNIVRVYSIERTLCDMLRGSRIDYFTVTNAMHRYASNQNRRPDKMLEIAERLRVRPKVMPFVEAMLRD